MFNIYGVEDNSFIVLLIVLGFFAAIAITTFIIYRIMHPKLKDQHQNTEQENAKEELDRILQPVEDEKIAKEIEDYEQKDDE